MQQDNNIEKKLQQLESQQLPDLSRMDEHWNNMQASLKPQNLPGKTGLILAKLILPLTALVVIFSGIYFLIENKHRQNNKTDEKNDKIMPSVNRDDLPVLPGDSVQVAIVPAVKVPGKNTHKQLVPFPPIDADVNIVQAGNGDTAFSFEEISRVENIPDKQALLADLFSQLRKAPQHFLINNKRDTTLICKEGTVVMVPANSFGGKDSIDFIVTEFYTYSDMVLNRLTTMSDQRQLITGGMLKIHAYRNDSLLQMKSHKAVKVFVPGLSESDSMQIFTERKNYEGDSLVSSGVNWVLSDTRMTTPELTRYVRAIDFLDYYNEIKGVESAGRKKSLFSISKETGLSRENIKTIMKTKYPEYHKMRFRKLRKRNFFLKEYNTETEHIYGATGHPGLGDTMYFEIDKFSRYAKNVTPIDTVWSDGSWNSNGKGRLVFNIETDTAKIRFAEKYSFLLEEFGWINCDRFYDYPDEKTNFYVSNEGVSNNVFTVLVFDRIKSIMGGYLTADNRIVFRNIPVGESVSIVSIGVNNYGKPILAFKKAVIGKQLEVLRYEEQEVAEIKNSLGVLNK